MDGIAESRAEMTAGIADVRGEMIAEMADLRREMIAGIAALQAEMIVCFEQVDRRLGVSLAVITQQFVEQRASTDVAFDRLDRADQSLNAGISRLERKLDRILALVVESRTRLR